MDNKLLIGVLGNHRSGKTETWNNLFSRKVRTGKHLRKLKVFDKDISIFLINGSPLERRTELEYIMPDKDPNIVLCSFLYHKKVKENFNYFLDRGYDIYIQWLNPGFSDESDKVLFYNVGIINYLLSHGATVSVENGKVNPDNRVNNIRRYLYAWSLMSENQHLKK